MHTEQWKFQQTDKKMVANKMNKRIFGNLLKYTIIEDSIWLPGKNGMCSNNNGSSAWELFVQ